LSIGDGVDGAEVVVVEVAGFVSADPYIQSPYNTQSYNRYSYVMNNPLKYTDPSGYNPIAKAWRS
jgi:hypothetical protein